MKSRNYIFFHDIRYLDRSIVYNITFLIYKLNTDNKQQAANYSG